MKLAKFFALALASLAFVACGGDKDDNTSKPTGDAVLTANNSSVEVNTPIEFTVTATDGTDLTAQASFFNKTADYAQVPNPFTPEMDGDYEFYAVVGTILTNTVKVSVVPTIPELPADAQPENTSFNHRILLVDHTGNTCGFCPQMMLALKEVEETGDYHSKYYEAMAHTYKQSDPASSSAAFAVSGHYGITNYPTLTYNFYHTTTSSYNAEHIMSQIDALWKEYAEVSVAASTSLATKSVVVNTEIKAALTAEYSINAWLLEDGIEAKQTNATADWMNIHDNAIRNVATTEPLSGYELGTIEAGKSVEQVLSLDIVYTSWNRDNLKVMLIVSKKNAKGKYDVANVAICPLNQSITYDYK